jgi:hypothetical protein
MVRSLEELASVGGLTARFVEGDFSATGHHWQLYGQNGWLLAHTTRTHSGGKPMRALKKVITMLALDVGDDVHQELRGAQGAVLARTSAKPAKPAVTTVVDAAGKPLAKTTRDNDVFTVYGPDDRMVATLHCEGDGPWPVRSPAGDMIGELLAGTPKPSMSPGLLWQLADSSSAIAAQSYNMSIRTGIRRVNGYSFAPTPGIPVVMPLPLLPLLCGLTF